MPKIRFNRVGIKTKFIQMEAYTIVKPGSHYDTNDEKFYSDSWDCTLDKKEYLENLIKKNPNKFRDCQIIINL